MFCSDVDLELGTGSCSDSESTSIMSTSGSSGYDVVMTERGRLPRALRWGVGGSWRTGVGEREGSFSLPELA